MAAALPGKQIRIIVVDDSAFMRKALTMMLESDPAIKVIATARDGEEGVEKVRHLKPDLVTMDIEMPRMDGLAALRQIMATTPVPVMMISSLTTDGARATLDALEMGAVDFIPKGMSYVSLDIAKIKDELVAKIKSIVQRKSLLMSRFRLERSGAPATGHAVPTVQPRPASPPCGPARKRHRHTHPIGLIAIGSSTGGPLALQQVIPRLPRNFPVGILVAQHMPPMFTASLAERLDQMSAVSVREAKDGEPVEPGTVLIAPGGKHLTVKKYAARPRAGVSARPADTVFHPCIDVTMKSVAAAYGRLAMGVILTGMGTNGVVGLGEIKGQGGIVIAQSAETCVVYGMPKAAVEAGLADIIVPIATVADEIVSFF